MITDLNRLNGVSNGDTPEKVSHPVRGPRPDRGPGPRDRLGQHLGGRCRPLRRRPAEHPCGELEPPATGCRPGPARPSPPARRRPGPAPRTPPTSSRRTGPPPRRYGCTARSPRRRACPARTVRQRTAVASAVVGVRVGHVPAVGDRLPDLGPAHRSHPVRSMCARYEATSPGVVPLPKIRSTPSASVAVTSKRGPPTTTSGRPGFGQGDGPDRLGQLAAVAQVRVLLRDDLGDQDRVRLLRPGLVSRSGTSTWAPRLTTAALRLGAVVHCRPRSSPGRPRTGRPAAAWPAPPHGRVAAGHLDHRLGRQRGQPPRLGRPPSGRGSACLS